MLDLFDKTLSSILQAETYPEFKKALIDSACTRCALCEGRTNIVVDRGNYEARVMVIGEGPGENEDLQGKAFVGRGGRLLDGMLSEVGFDTNKDSLIANVVKCRPPKNRAPEKEEAGTCFPYLKKQIELVRPKFILLLGATALKYILPGQKFTMRDEVGKFFDHPEYPGIRFMVLFHPAYILRDPRKKPLMAEHLKFFKTEWEGAR